MKRLILTGTTLLAFCGLVRAEPEYTRIAMEIDVDRPAAQVWAAIGDYCDISEWFNLDCEITSGDGGIGTVRALAGGRILEILVAETELSYGYTQPAREGQFYNLYHGFLEARPIGDNRTRLLYTLLLDESNQPDQAAKDADVARRRASFENALSNMKNIAESQ
ncbi:MAG: SRPBCC family protein [Gammaproteobacteria bacterium]|nr:SRPBCC family protein [Pseudomonadales bacterium]MCP5347531.1 SRPBCC family protein [Pseudomonadales bacterium]